MVTLQFGLENGIMAWRVESVMDQRLCFIAACLRADEPMSDLCLRFKISRKTGYKWLSRYRDFGAAGLVALSSARLRLIRRSPMPSSRCASRDRPGGRANCWLVCRWTVRRLFGQRQARSGIFCIGKGFRSRGRGGHAIRPASSPRLSRRPRTRAGKRISRAGSAPGTAFAATR